MSNVRLGATRLFCRLIPTGTPGKSRIARLLLGKHSKLKDVAIRLRNGRAVIAPNLQEPIAFHAFIDGVYEPRLIEFLRRSLRTGDTFVDVGANIGAISLLAIDMVGESGRVLALEPSPNVFPYLSLSIEEARLRNLCGLQVAAGDRLGTMPFYLPPDEQFGMGSLVPRFHDKPIGVTVETLDSLLTKSDIDRVAVLKVDVEGAEAAVFTGAKRLLESASPPLIVFEFCDWAEQGAGTKPGDSQRLLKEMGYQMWLLEDYLRGGQPIPTILEKGFHSIVARKSAGC